MEALKPELVIQLLRPDIAGRLWAVLPARRSRYWPAAPTLGGSYGVAEDSTL